MYGTSSSYMPNWHLQLFRSHWYHNNNNNNMNLKLFRKLQGYISP